jgi:hypothetical protein
MFNELKERIELQHTDKENEQEIIIKEMIIKGESELLEMKSSLRFDFKDNSVNKKLEFVIAKTVSAFLNSE